MRARRRGPSAVPSLHPAAGVKARWCSLGMCVRSGRALDSTERSHMTIAGLENPPTQNKKLLEWVEQVAALAAAGRIEWADGSQEEWDRLTQLMVDDGIAHPAQPRASARTSFLARSDPSDVARVEDRTFICSLRGARRRPDQQLGRPGRDAPDTCKGLFEGSMRGRTMYVVPFSMGPLGSPDLAAGRRDHRLALRRGQHAHHDAHGQGRPGPDRRRRRLRARRALGRLPAGRRAGRPPRGRARGRAATPSTSSTSPRPARSGPTAPATAATRCWARSASRCGSPRRWRATRAGWPSTC